MLDSVAGYLERRDQANTFAQLGAALTGLDMNMLRFVGRMFASRLAGSRATARQERWQAACLELAGAGDRLIDRAWDHLARKTHDHGLALPTASELADACWQVSPSNQDELDGSFEQTLTRAHSLAGATPTRKLTGPVPDGRPNGEEVAFGLLSRKPETRGRTSGTARRQQSSPIGNVDADHPDLGCGMQTVQVNCPDHGCQTHTNRHHPQRHEGGDDRMRN